MPSDGLIFEWLPTAGHACFACALTFFLLVGVNIFWHLLTDDDEPTPAGTSDEVLRAITRARLHELEQELDRRDNR